MILLTSARLPDSLSRMALSQAARMLFPHEGNREYFDSIDKRADLPAVESLFALTLLYDQIRMLPSDIDTAKLVLARSEMGKPYFEDSPVKFNVSHSKGYVAVAVSLGEELGVDVEASALPRERAAKMAERYFSVEEQKEVLNNEKSFARLWSEKEAKAKFFGESIGNLLSNEKILDFSKDFESLRLHRFSIDNHPITLCTKRDFSTIIFTVQ